MESISLKGETMETGYLRHIRACNNVTLPGERLPFRIGSAQVGWVKPDLAARLASFPQISTDADGLTLADAAALPGIARQLADAGGYRWRAEEFDIRAEADGPVLARLDRGALPSFGVLALGVHVNGLVRRSDGLHIWVARRAANKHLDPGKLDHIVGGGVPAGLTPAETLIKEAEEEATVPASLARQAVEVARIGYAMERPEGLRRDLLYCYDLDLPEEFSPHAADGEVEAFELWPIGRVMHTVRDTDEFKFNVTLVLIDLFQRLRLL
jgi:8-oxo-dGTP pyrophosphatase MutT (NUDIX family)